MRVLPILLVTLICCAAGAQGAAAAPPPNDAFGLATPITALPAEVPGTVAESTRESGEPGHDGRQRSGGVWYSFTPAQTTSVIARTCQAQFDTVLAVYTGDGITALTPVTSNDDACETGSLVTWTASAGTTYFISVSPFEALRRSDRANFTLSLAVLMPPANDNLAAATPLALPAEVPGTVAESTRETGEPVHAGHGRNGGVWYSFTPSETASVLARTCRAQFDTVLAVYTGNGVSALTRVTSNDDSCGTGSLVTWTASAGTTYFISVSPFDTLPPNDRANFTLSLAVATPPANDAFVSALRLTRSRTVRGSNVLATPELGEPRHFSGGGHSVWFRYRATRTRRVTIDTVGSSFDTVLAVYRGDLGRLRRVARNDDGGPGLTSRIRLRVRRGRTYFVALDGTLGESGEWEFRLSRRRGRL